MSYAFQRSPKTEWEKGIEVANKGLAIIESEEETELEAAESKVRRGEKGKEKALATTGGERRLLPRRSKAELTEYEKILTVKGMVLNNMGRIDEAEIAFAQALQIAKVYIEFQR